MARGDHLRLQDVRLAYDLDKKGWRHLPVAGVQVYAYAANLGLLWRANKLGIDPDYTGYDVYPAPRTVAVGLKVDF